MFSVWNTDFVRADNESVKDLVKWYVNNPLQIMIVSETIDDLREEFDLLTERTKLEEEISNLERVTDPAISEPCELELEKVQKKLNDTNDALNDLNRFDKSELTWKTFTRVDALLKVLSKKPGCLNWHPCFGITRVLFGEQKGAWVWNRLQKWDHKFPCDCPAPYVAAVMRCNDGWRQMIAFCVTALLLQGNTHTGRRILNTDKDVDAAFEMLREAHRKCGLPFYVETNKWWPTRGWNKSFENSLMCLWDSKPATKLRSESSIYEPIAAGRMIEAVKAAIEGLGNNPSYDDKLYDLSQNDEIVRCLTDHTSEFKEIKTEEINDYVKSVTESLFPGLIA